MLENLETRRKRLSSSATVGFFQRENEVLFHSKFVEFLLAETFESRKYIQLQGRQIQCVVFQMQAQ